MNYRMIKYTLGWMMLFEAAFFLVPIITAVAYQEWMTLVALLISAALCLAIGYLCKRKKPDNTSIYAREGFVIVSLCWILLSLFGCIPFVLSGLFTGAPISFIDALFETASGFTTTGSSTENRLPSCLHSEERRLPVPHILRGARWRLPNRSECRQDPWIRWSCKRS